MFRGHSTRGCALARKPFRRLSDQAENAIPAEILCQSIHIGDLKGDRTEMLWAGDAVYYLHSADSASAEIEEGFALGLGSVFAQLMPPRGVVDATARIEHFAAVVATLKRRFGSRLFLIVDPQGLCMQPDLRWGMVADDGQIDPELTLCTLYAAAYELAKAGIDAFVTIGRMNCEVEVARAALDASRPDVELYAFSTNSETPIAYFDATAFNPDRAITGQKILVGNTTEMILRACMDVDEGIGVMIQKPLENIAVLSTLRQLGNGTASLDAFLDSASAQRLMNDNIDIHPWDRLRTLGFREKLRALKLGAYEVSGTFCIARAIEKLYGTELAWAVYQETLSNVVAACGGRPRWIIGRTMQWFVKNAPTR